MARTIGSIGGETAHKVRRAALKLFARKGYAAVSMREIAAEVGLQAGALYNHFPNKQAILADLMAAHMEALIGAWEAESHKFTTPPTALEGFVRFHIRYHLDRTDEVFISYMELRNLEPANFARIEGLRKYYEGCLRKVLQAGLARGDFDIADVPVAAMAIIAMLTGLNTWFRTGGRLSVDAVEQIYVTMALGSVERSVTAKSPELVG